MFLLTFLACNFINSALLCYPCCKAGLKNLRPHRDNLFASVAAESPSPGTRIIWGGTTLVEKRKHKRIPLHYYLKVTENDSAEHIGFMIDISEEGFKLLSEKEIPMGTELVCKVHLPDELEGARDLTFKARSCWVGKDVNPDYFASGYHIDEMEPSGETVIALIMRNYGYNNA